MQNTVEEIEAIQNLIAEAQSTTQSLDLIEVTW